MKIKINEYEFVTDVSLTEFKPLGKPVQGSRSIPVEQLKYKDGEWFILWDSQDGTYYDMGKQQPLPLSVQWIKVNKDDRHPWKEKLDTIILLSESIWRTRNLPSTNKARKCDTNLQKCAIQFNQ